MLYKIGCRYPGSLNKIALIDFTMTSAHHLDASLDQGQRQLTHHPFINTQYLQVLKPTEKKVGRSNILKPKSKKLPYPEVYRESVTAPS